MLCPICGAEIPDESLFCFKCGAPIVTFDENHPSDDPNKTTKISWASVRLRAAEAARDADEQVAQQEPVDDAMVDGAAVNDEVTTQTPVAPEPADAASAEPAEPAEREQVAYDQPAYETGYEDEADDHYGHADDADDYDDLENYGFGFDESDYGHPAAFKAASYRSARMAGMTPLSDDVPVRPLPFSEPETASSEAIAFLRPQKRNKKPLIILVAVVAVIVAAVAINSVITQLSAPIAINASVVPDEAVRDAILASDDDGDGKLTKDQLAQITELNIESAQEISGLGILPNLQSVAAAGAQLTSVDVSDCPSLVTLDVSNSGVASLNVTGLGKLEQLDVSTTALTEIDISTLASLTTLDVSNTSIKSVDVTACTGLASLQCPDDVVVTGLEASQLQEYWLPVEYEMDRPLHYYYDSANYKLSVEYDESNRIERISYIEDDDEQYSAHYSYGDTGRLTSINQSLGGYNNLSWTLGYDAQGRLSTALDSSDGEHLTYTYDESGKLASIESDSPYGTSQAYTYNADGLLVQIEGDDGATLTRDEQGRMVSYVTNDEKYTYDITYDSAGRVTQVDMVLSYLGSATETFVYDQDGRIVNAVRVLNSDAAELQYPFPDISQSEFTYDEHGNITGVTQTYSTDRIDDTCTIAYKRVFATPDKAPLGQSPLISDPLMLCDANDWFWCPWVTMPYSSTTMSALVHAFTPDSQWITTNCPLPVVAGANTASTSGAGDDSSLDTSVLTDQSYTRYGDETSSEDTTSIG